RGPGRPAHPADPPSVDSELRPTGLVHRLSARSHPHSKAARLPAYAPTLECDASGRPVSIIRMNASNRYAASWGPGAASGWYCTAKIGLLTCRKPASVPSLRLTCVGSPPT